MDSYYISPIEAVSIMIQDKDIIKENELSGLCDVEELKDVPFKVTYDKDLEIGNSYLKDSFISDGTLWFELESLMKIVQAVIGLSATKNKPITIGKIKISNEDCKGTKDKPWLTLRTICEMPYIIEEGEL